MVTRNVKSLSLGRFVPYAAVALLTLASTTTAEARSRYFHYRHHYAAAHRWSPPAQRGRANFASSVASNFAAMVVDANSGRTLYAVNEDAPRHPASITKVMTLYLLFEELERGRMRLDSPLTVSAHAAAQSPTKLGLRPGSTISVENAIKAIVTKSANDMAVTVAENIAGDEESFAAAMTEKAHSLGMSHTFYHNASGLPDMRQLTTARDLTILGRVIRERFPRYYHYFSTPSFTYAGSFMPNHNHLMERVDGMDGIKTGYTAASGFNLLSSVNRDGRHIVSVVLGGRTAASRDRVMQALIETHIEEASATPSTRVADAAGPVEEPSSPPSQSFSPPPVDRQKPMHSQDVGEADDTDAAAPDSPTVPTRVTFSSSEAADGNVERAPPRGPNLIAPDLALPAVPLRRAAQIARPLPPPRLAQVAEADLESAAAPRSQAEKPQAPSTKTIALKPPKPEKIRPAFIAGAPKTVETARMPGPMGAKERQRFALDGSTNRRPSLNEAGSGAVATATPSSLHWVTGAQPVRLGPSADKAKINLSGKPAVEPSSTGSIDHSATRFAKAEAPSSSGSRGGWIIQVGATDNAGKANDLLSRAKTEGRSALASARPFTEKVQKGDATLYRARFAGLEPNEAEAACKTLKRSGFACFATRN